MPSATGEELATTLYNITGESAAIAINLVLIAAYVESQTQVPRDPEHDLKKPHEPALHTTGKHPGNDPEVAARWPTASGMVEGMFGYDHPAALAQELGYMEMHSKNGVDYEWRVANYSTPGTKSHFVSDPGKAALAEFDVVFADTHLGMLLDSAVELSSMGVEIVYD